MNALLLYEVVFSFGTGVQVCMHYVYDDYFTGFQRCIYSGSLIRSDDV